MCRGGWGVVPGEGNGIPSPNYSKISILEWHRYAFCVPLGVPLWLVLFPPEWHIAAPL